MLVAPLATQSASGQATQTKTQPAAQHTQTVAKPIAKPAQPHITFTAKQFDEYEDKILDRAEGFYNNRMSTLLWIIGIFMGIVGIIMPLVISGFMQWQRKISFTKELAQADEKILKSTKEQTKELEKKLISQIDDREAKQTIAISSYLSMIFSGLGTVFGTQKSEIGYSLWLQSQILAMKLSISGQCGGGCLTASQIIQTMREVEMANNLALKTLEAANADIEDMKRELDKIANVEKRVDMESQVKQLQIYVCALIHEKQRDDDTTPPQAKP